MEIEAIEKVEIGVRISEVAPGQCFICDGVLYIRAQTNFNYQGFNPFNGLWRNFAEDYLVQPIRAKIVIQEPCILKQSSTKASTSPQAHKPSSSTKTRSSKS